MEVLNTYIHQVIHYPKDVYTIYIHVYVLYYSINRENRNVTDTMYILEYVYGKQEVFTQDISKIIHF